METGAHVWLRSPLSKWGWVPAVIAHKEEFTQLTRAKIGGRETGGTFEKKMVRLTLVNDPLCYERSAGGGGEEFGDYFYNVPEFEEVITMDPESLKKADHDDVKLRNLGVEDGENNTGGGTLAMHSPAGTRDVVEGAATPGLVHDLIHLTHLHEPAILHSLRLRYDQDVIYTSTGPILIAINPFKKMEGLYGGSVMEGYRMAGEGSRYV